MMDIPEALVRAVKGELRAIEKWSDDWLCAFHESHLAFIAGRAFSKAGAVCVVPEVKPPEYGKESLDRCDLFARIGAMAYYLEAKKGWHGVGWNNKPGEQLRAWLYDL